MAALQELHEESGLILSDDALVSQGSVFVVGLCGTLKSVVWYFEDGGAVL